MFHDVTVTRQCQLEYNGCLGVQLHIFTGIRSMKQTLSSGRRKRGNIAAETFRVNVAHNVAWVSKRERSKTFMLPRPKFCLFKICCLGIQTRNIWETFGVSVSSVFPKRFLVCALTQHMFKTQNLRLESKKCF